MGSELCLIFFVLNGPLWWSLNPTEPTISDLSHSKIFIVRSTDRDSWVSLLVLIDIENHFSSPHQSTLLHRGGYTKGIDSETGFENIQLLDIISDDSTLKRGS